MVKKIFIGTAWPYVNGDLHPGHLAGYLIPADIFSRYCRLKGYQVLMVSGTDCHGTPITLEADKMKISPSALVKKYHPKVLKLIETYDISYDLFTSTTNPVHKKITQQFFLKLLKNGFIRKKQTYQYFSNKENRFLPDRYVEGECKFCKSKDQRGDQCEVCGRSLNPGDLISPKSKLTGSEVILKKTEHYFLDYKKLEKEIYDFVFNSNHWREWVYKESLGFLKEGLQERAITRDLDWGIKIPIDQIPSKFLISDLNKKRFYVWFEAVIGYFSASVKWAKIKNKNWQDFWLDKACRHYYFMGKDNLIFHTIFWPGQLIGQRENYNLPYFPAVNHFLMLEGKKFSKSRGVIIDSLKISKEYTVDNVRFYIASILPETKDSDFKFQDFKQSVNNKLVDKIGNLIYRVLIFYKNNLKAKIDINCLDNIVLNKIEQSSFAFQNNLEKVKIVDALNDVLNYVDFINQYLDKNQPWKLLNTDKDRCQEVIYSCLEAISFLRFMLWPFLPHSISRLNKMLNLDFKISEGKDLFIFEKTGTFKIKQPIKPLYSKIP
jgi:methionyl-tRNA synthetase